MSTQYSTDIYRKVARRTGIDIDEARRIIEATLDTVEQSVAQGNRVTLMGFGSFGSYARAGRTIPFALTQDDPGDSVTIPPHRVVTFRTGSSFRGQLESRQR